MLDNFCSTWHWWKGRGLYETGSSQENRCSSSLELQVLIQRIRGLYSHWERYEDRTSGKSPPPTHNLSPKHSSGCFSWAHKKVLQFLSSSGAPPPMVSVWVMKKVQHIKSLLGRYWEPQVCQHLVATVPPYLPERDGSTPLLGSWLPHSGMYGPELHRVGLGCSQLLICISSSYQSCNQTQIK